MAKGLKLVWVALALSACGNDIEAVKADAASKLRNPESAQFRNVRLVSTYLTCSDEMKDLPDNPNADQIDEFRDQCRHEPTPSPDSGATPYETVCGEMNGENGFGGMAGFARFFGSNGLARVEPEGDVAKIGGKMSAYWLWANDYAQQCQDDSALKVAEALLDA